MHLTQLESLAHTVKQNLQFGRFESKAKHYRVSTPVKERCCYEAVVLGVMAGGVQLIKELVMTLPENFSMAVIIAQHADRSPDNAWIDILNKHGRVIIKEVEENEVILPGRVYIAPAHYRIIVQCDRTLNIIAEENFNDPGSSIDSLFKTASETYQEHLIGIVCAEEKSDGVNALSSIRAAGSLAITKESETQLTSPSAIDTANPDYVLSKNKIFDFLLKMHMQKLLKHKLNN